MTFLKGSDFLGQLQCLVRKQSLDCQASQNKGCDLILFHQQSSIFSIISSRRYYLVCNIVNRAVIATTCRNSNVKKVSPNTAHKPHHALKDEGEKQSKLCFRTRHCNCPRKSLPFRKVIHVLLALRNGDQNYEKSVCHRR